MKTIKKILNWFKESNRYKHALAGVLIFIVMIVVNNFVGINTITNLFNSTLVVIISMLSVEYKDSLCGNKFDWYDIIAGVSLVIIVDIIVCLITQIF